MNAPRFRPTSVLMIGPDPAHLGGMATVVGQMLEMDFADSFDVSYQPVSVSPHDRETHFDRVRRHGRQIQETRDRLRSTHPAILHLHTCSGFSFYRSAVDAWLGRRGGSRIVLHVHGAAFDQFCRQAGPLARRIIRWNLEVADRVIALSPQWAVVLQEVAPRARIVVIPNAVDVAVPLTTGKNSAGPCRFFLLAKMDEWKGIDDLLEACRLSRRRDVAMEVVLAGPPGSAGNAVTLARKIADYGLTEGVRYVGPVQGQDKAAWFAWADAYVQPSRHEGLPLSVLEAMAHGLPVIATTVGALPEVIRDGLDGRLTPPHRPDLLLAAMRELADDPDLRRQMGARARQVVQERFSLARFQNDLRLLYEQLLIESKGTNTAVNPRTTALTPGPVFAPTTPATG